MSLVHGWKVSFGARLVSDVTCAYIRKSILLVELCFWRENALSAIFLSRNRFEPFVVRSARQAIIYEQLEGKSS
jgi:hypothetical protein